MITSTVESILFFNLNKNTQKRTICCHFLSVIERVTQRWPQTEPRRRRQIGQAGCELCRSDPRGYLAAETGPQKIEKRLISVLPRCRVFHNAAAGQSLEVLQNSNLLDPVLTSSRELAS